MSTQPTAPPDANVSHIADRPPPRLRQPSLEERRRLVSESLNVGNPRNNARTLPEIADPKFDCQLELGVEEIRPYERNPRRSNNAKFDEIKESIRVSGIRNPITVTRRPNESHFIVEAGGNTRLLAIQQLWAETKEPRFKRITVMFRPWRCESHVLMAHLIENEQRGELTFWDKANGIMVLKAQLECEKGQSLVMRQLEEELRAIGLAVGKSNLSLYAFATQRLTALAEALPALTGMDARRIQSRMNLLKRYVDRLGTVSEADFYSKIIDLVLSRHGRRYAANLGFDDQALCADWEEVLAEHLKLPAEQIRMSLDVLESAIEPPASASIAPTGATAAATVTNADSRDAGANAVPIAVRGPDRLPAALPGIAARGPSDAHRPAPAATSTTASSSAAQNDREPETLAERAARFAELTAVADCYRRLAAAPHGFFMEIPATPLDLDPARPLRHRGWWLLALISGQMHEHVSRHLPAQSHWRRIHTHEGGIESALPLLIENELAGPVSFDVMLTDWLLDPADEAAALFWEIVALVRNSGELARQSFAMRDYSNPSAKDE